MRNKVAVGLICLLAGLGLGFLIGGAGSSEPDTDMGVSSISSRGDEASGNQATPNEGSSTASYDAGTADSNTSGTGEASGETGATTPDVSSDDLLAALLKSLPDQPLPPGDGTINGVVRDQSGTGLPGVRVTILCRAREGLYEDEWEYYYDEDEDPLTPEGLLEQLKEHKQQLRNTFHTTTNEAGEFSFDGLGDVSATVSAKIQGYKVESLYSVRVGAELVLRAMNEKSLTVDVILPDGGRPKTAQIWLESDEDYELYRWSTDDSEIGILGKPISISVGTYHAGKHYSGEVSPLPSLSELGGRLTVKLEPQVTIDGRVTMEWRPSGLDYLYGSWEWSDTDTGSDKSYGEDVDNSLYVDLSNGSFTFQIPRHGTIDIRLGWVEGETDVTKRLVIDRDTTEVEIALPMPPRENFVVIDVRDPEGNVVQGSADIEVGVEDLNSSYVEAMRTPRGQYWIALAEIEDNLGKSNVKSEFYVFATSSKYGRAGVIVPLGALRYATIQFREPALVTAVVTNYLNHKAMGKLVAIIVPEAKANNVYWYEARTVDDKGRAELAPAAPGKHILLLGVENAYNWGGYDELARIETTLTSGPNEVSIQAPPLYDLIVQVEGANEVVSVDIDSETVNREKDTDRSGTVTFHNLPAGTYRISADYETRKTVTIPQDSRVILRKLERNALRVTFTNEESNVAKAGFISGDLIIGIDGVIFETRKDLERLEEAYESGEDVDLVIRRDGDDTTLHVNLKAVFDKRTDGDGVDRVNRDNPDG